MKRNWILPAALITTGLVAVAFVGKQKLDDLDDNLKVIVTKVRVHGFVNTYFMRLVATVRLVNNSTTTIPITNMTMDMLVQTGTNEFAPFAFIPTAIPSLTLKAGQTAEHQIDIDVNLLQTASPVISLLKGQKITLRTKTNLYVLGIRVPSEDDVPVEIPAQIRSFISFIPGLKGLPQAGPLLIPQTFNAA